MTKSNSILELFFHKGKFLGKGSFASCYELKCIRTNFVFAGKIIDKARLIDLEFKNRIKHEIIIQKNLNHGNIVKFYSAFEDEHHIFILTELCKHNSLKKMLDKRKVLTEFEVKYMVKQIALGCDYLHKLNIAHRDLKPANLFLNDKMILKLGDFGLAKKLNSNFDQNKTICGTPNFVAPEILDNIGYDCKVDVWSLGCIVYTMVVGSPPFQTDNINSTIFKIRENKIYFPNLIKEETKIFIKKLLNCNSVKRLSMKQILDDIYMQSYIPQKLPTSCLITKPKLKELIDFNNKFNINCGKKNLKKNPEDLKNQIKTSNNEMLLSFINYFKYFNQLTNKKNLEQNFALIDLMNKLNLHPNLCSLKFIKQYKSKNFFYITKWIYLPEDFGFAYQLNNEITGINFNDNTKLLLDNMNVEYLTENFLQNFPLTDIPSNLEAKVKILTKFYNFMKFELKTFQIKSLPLNEDFISDKSKPFLVSKFRSTFCMIFLLSNSTLQISFLNENFKIILCPRTCLITIIDEEKEYVTPIFNLNQILSFNKNFDLNKKINYVAFLVDKILYFLKSN